MCSLFSLGRRGGKSEGLMREAGSRRRQEDGRGRNGGLLSGAKAQQTFLAGGKTGEGKS